MAASPDFLAALARILGPKGLTRDPDVMAPWLSDWRGRYRGAALAIASPATTAEVAAVVRACSAQRVAIVPQGGNSGMVAGATPDPSGGSLLLSLRRMDAIDSAAMADRRVTAEAGVVLETLHGAAATHGMRFPLTLGGKGSATVGGLISTNAGGTQVLRHGSMRALVAGIEAVLPDGSVFADMAGLAKDNRGYAVRELLIGAEGTLGVVTRAKLRLVPALIDRCVAWAGLDTLEQARTLLRHCRTAAGPRLEGFEVLPQTCLTRVLAAIPGTRAPLERPARWHALIEFVRDSADQDDPQTLAEAALQRALADGLDVDMVVASNEAQATGMWRIRDSISEAERLHGAAIQHDVSVPVARMPAFVDDASARVAARFAGATCAAFGHLGDGNVHFHVRAPDRIGMDEWEILCPDISDLVYDIVDEYEGSIAAEHGIGRAKRDLLPGHLPPARLAAMRAIKAAFDPYGIMNPGVLLTAESGDAAPQRPIERPGDLPG